ncbi:hypothetical protein [Protofrankia coriariae]|uniref:Uncharacterized protein n=1 Tax=Protofrankia coriariae TaxID=1562887 RepID=A0ABR5EZT0_9ACTN|nr:hypothetical protein [Protofrankia coriariae]KLL09960.1 hypothetical protein FrCorBMG51_21260 [Protofrankia coriariae]
MMVTDRQTMSACRILVHLIGAADLGASSGEQFWERLAELVAAGPDEAGRLLTTSVDPARKTPLIAVFAAGAPQYDRVVLVVTRPRAGQPADAGQTLSLGEVIKDRLEFDGLYGVGFPPGAVELLEADGPYLAGTRPVIRRRLRELRDAGVLLHVDITFGGGATNAAMGLVIGALESEVEPHLVLLAERGGHRILPSEKVPSANENDDRWLVRHRFYSSMVTRDPDNAELWQRRRDRQILVAESVDGIDENDTGEEELARVLLERIDRREVVDGMLFDAWLKARVRNLAARDGSAGVDADLDAWLGDLIRRRFPDRRTRAAGDKLFPPEIRKLRAARAARGAPTSALDLLLEPRARDAEMAAKDLVHVNRTNPRDLGIIRRFLETQSYLPGYDEKIVELGYPRWSYLGSRRALILLALGADPIEGADPPTPRLDALIQQAQREGVEPLIRILVSEQSEPVGRLWETKARRSDVDCRVIQKCGTDFDDLDHIRWDVWDALQAEGDLDAVKEVWAVVGTGPKPQGLGVLLAGIEWGLSAACPTRLVAIRRDAAGSDRSIVEIDQDAVLNRVAGDAELARVALSALECLDVSAAVALLGQGSAQWLRPLADRARRLAFIGPSTAPDPRWLASIGLPDDPARLPLLLLRARLHLVEPLAESDPWGCAVRAAVLCEGTLGKKGGNGWYTLHQHIPQARKIAEYRNASPASHGKEKAARTGRAVVPPSAKELRECLRGLREGLSGQVTVDGAGLPDTWDAVLVDEHERLRGELRAFTAAA